MKSIFAALVFALLVFGGAQASVSSSNKAHTLTDLHKLFTVYDYVCLQVARVENHDGRYVLSETCFQARYNVISGLLEHGKKHGHNYADFPVKELYKVLTNEVIAILPEITAKMNSSDPEYKKLLAEVNKIRERREKEGQWPLPELQVNEMGLNVYPYMKQKSMVSAVNHEEHKPSFLGKVGRRLKGAYRALVY